MVTINGEKEDLAGNNLYECLKSKGYDIERVVVELNLEILSKDDLKNVIIADEDSIEVLRFVGGG